MERYFLSTKGPNPYVVEWVRFSTGERAPFLIRVATGLPIEAATYWSLAFLRAVNVQSSTIRNQLRALMFLYLWADLRQVDLSARLNNGEFFTLGEILDIVNVAGRFLDDVLEELTTNLVSFRSRKDGGVQSDERRNRLAAAYSFIDFVSADIQSRLTPWPQRAERYSSARSACLKLLQAHVSAAGNRGKGRIDEREGMEEAAILRLRAVIEPDHSENPFRRNVRFRNYLIVRLLLDLGIRRGELLGIKVSDLSLGSSGTVTIHRRPDDPEDPRVEKPDTKTLARLLALSGRLTELVHEYVVYYRAKLPEARRHPYLIVSMIDGAPLSISSINKIFLALRERVPGMPDDLSPHLLRHTWNDAFSDHMDRTGVLPENEVKWRTRLMGWRSEDSAKHYLRRTVRRRSNEVLKSLQDHLEIGPGRGKL